MRTVYRLEIYSLGSDAMFYVIVFVSRAYVVPLTGVIESAVCSQRRMKGWGWADGLTNPQRNLISGFRVRRE